MADFPAGTLGFSGPDQAEFRSDLPDLFDIPLDLDRWRYEIADKLRDDEGVTVEERKGLDNLMRRLNAFTFGLDESPSGTPGFYRHAYWRGQPDRDVVMVEQRTDGHLTLGLATFEHDALFRSPNREAMILEYTQPLTPADLSDRLLEVVRGSDEFASLESLGFR